jgi:hypothetical protein
MPRTQGTVGAVEAKTTQAGKTYYKVNVNGTWYSIWENPNVSPGDEIEFDVIQKGEYKNMAKPSKLASGAVVGSPGRSTVQTSRPNGSFDPDRESRIVRQNATSSAVALVGASKLAGKADVETILGTVREVAKKVFEMNFYGYDISLANAKPQAEAKSPSVESTGFFDE